MSATSTGRKAPNAIDVHIGQKIRARRVHLGMSQGKLADALRLTFQQVQKYEKGVNRVGGSRLQQISDALGVSPSHFFNGAPTDGKRAAPPNEGELSQLEITSFLATRDGAMLVRSCLAIKPSGGRSHAHPCEEVMREPAKAAWQTRLLRLV